VTSLVRAARSGLILVAASVDARAEPVGNPVAETVWIPFAERRVLGPPGELRLEAFV
jgi:hypothetical protein